MNQSLQSKILAIQQDIVGKTLDHSTQRMPGEAQMYKMYIESSTEAILALFEELIDETRERYNLRSELKDKIR